MSHIDIKELLSKLTEVLKGIARDVPARMAIEHAITGLARCASIRWSAFVLLTPRPQGVAQAGADAPPLSEIEAEVARIEALGSFGEGARALTWGGDEACDPLLAMPTFDESADRVGWLLACTRGADAELERLLEMVAWLLSAALEHDRLQGQISTLDQRHLTVIESLPHVVYEQDLGGEMVYVSRKIRRLTGVRAEELASGEVRFEELIHPEDRARRRAALDGVLPAHGPSMGYDLFTRMSDERWQVEYRLLHRNGRDIVWVADHFVMRMRNPTETVSSALGKEDFIVVGALIDLRERKQLEIESLQQSKLATIGELAAGVAHEINNPLTAVLTYGQLLDRWFRRQPIPEVEAEKGAEYLRHILEQGRVIDGITRNLTGFVRKGSSEDFQPVNVQELLETSLAIFRYPFKKERIRLSLDAPTNLPPIRARAGQLRQVILNLVTNARTSLNARFPEAEGINERKAILVAASCPEGEDAVRLTITDFGEGISTEHREKIFDAFFSTRKDGTGLGLSIVAKILQQHQARIEVRSNKAEGTSFVIDIPLWSSASAADQ